MWISRDFRVACLIACLMFTNIVNAAAVPAYNGRMNAAVGGVIQQKMSKWGFAANDPRIGATLTGVGSAATTVAVAVATGGVAAVGWPAILIGAGITAVVSGAISLGQDALTKWMFNADGTVTSTLPGTTTSNSNGTAEGGPYWYSSAHNIVGGSPEDVMRGMAQKYGITGWDSVRCMGASVSRECELFNSTQQFAVESARVDYVSSGAPTTCAGTYYGGTCNALPGSAPQTATKTLPQTISDLPESEAQKPLSDEAIAAAANATWRSMTADTSDNRLPWSASDPITPADVAEWKANNPASVPKVGDMLAPAVAPNTSTVSVSPSTTTNPAPGPAPTPGSGTQVDLGANPNIPPPGLEVTPTAPQILSPILNLMPDLKNFSVPAHNAICPQPRFSALGNEYTLSSHCELLESNRAIIEAAMMLVFSIAATLIVLRA